MKTATTTSFRLAPAAILFLPAFLLVACVESAQLPPQAPPPQPQPAIVVDNGIYQARSDERFTVPAIPVARIPEAYRRQTVSYQTDQAPGTIIIDPTRKLLYYILGDGKAIRYGISVGREGFQWSGTANVAAKRRWPTWTPPKEMIARQPQLEKWKDGQPGGPTNPLGSRAIYLATNGVDHGYRIHGTPEWQTIGRNASSGCFRMINQDVMDLFERVRGGEKVIVLNAKGEIPDHLSIPPSPTPKKPDTKPVATPEPVKTALPGTITAGPIADEPGVKKEDSAEKTSILLKKDDQAPAGATDLPAKNDLPSVLPLQQLLKKNVGAPEQGNSIRPSAE